MASRTPLVLQIGTQYEHGGEGRVIAELAKFLPAAGFDVVGAVAGPDNVAELTKGHFVNFGPENGPKLARFRSARAILSRIVEEQKPEVVASHFALYALPALDKLRKCPMVTHFHGPWGAESAQDGAGELASKVRAAVEKTVYGQARRVIVLSKAFSELVQERYGINAERIRIVPGCVDVDRFRPTMSKVLARERLGLPLDRPILFSIRRLVARMGLAELISAMRLIKRDIPDVLLCIAGRGLLKRALEQQVREAGLEEHVRFLGFVEDESLPLFYRAADLNILPTLALEGFGLVAAEGLAAGTPSLVTPVGGLPDVVSQLSENLIFASTRQEDLANRITSALLGRVAMPSGDECSAYAARHFNSALMAERTSAVYREVL